MLKPPRVTWRGGKLPAIKSREFRRYLPKPSNLDGTAIARARKEVVEFILIYQQLRATSLGQAIEIIEERIRERKIPPHLVDAVIAAHAHPNRIGSVNLSRGTLYRWVNAYKLTDGNLVDLTPTPTKTLYANRNIPLRTK